MRVASVIILAALATSVRADDGDREAAAPTVDEAAAPDVRGTLRAQLAAEAAVAAKNAAIDADKRDLRAAARAGRARAAYKLLRGGSARLWVEPAERMATARRRAAARHILADDRAEIAILSDELLRVLAGSIEVGAARAAVETARLPEGLLAWPARGEVVRHFGQFVHDDSKATLSRHGLDLEVDDHAAAHAMADGVVRYAGPIRGLDQGVIVDHGAVWSVIAKLGDPAVHVGQRVAAGDVLGAAARHRLYLELRIPVGRGGLPIDPEPQLEPR
ncbi:MAG: peptidoglycan DD-metalloendopeptidase family protein [Deltaproteobacteria bacterium]|nr:peptidoglycan DD-metalloendopeptidase family protein [Deltaproteobacteria bacterium]